MQLLDLFFSPNVAKAPLRKICFAILCSVLLATATAIPNVSINEKKEQSPVDIVTWRAVPDRGAALQLRSWDLRLTGDLTNTGHSVLFTPTSQVLPKIAVGNQNYKVCQVHFHWGSTSVQGSEHTVNGRLYSGEVHIVSIQENYSCKDIESFQTRGNVVVVGVFLNSVYSTRNPLWEVLCPVPIRYHKSTTVTGFQLSSLLPSCSLFYYSYGGSLTTGEYKEIVQWFVLATPIDVPESFLSQLRSTLDEHGHRTTRNFRQVQPLYERKVKTGTADLV